MRLLERARVTINAFYYLLIWSTTNIPKRPQMLGAKARSLLILQRLYHLFYLLHSFLEVYNIEAGEDR